MKKFALVILVALAVGFVTSCKPREKCPAYGKYIPAKQQPAARS